MSGEPKSKHTLIQNVQKINIKNKFFLPESQATLKVKRREITPDMKGAIPSSTPALYAKVFYCFKK